MRVLDSDPGALNSKALSRASDQRFGQLGAASALLLVLVVDYLSLVHPQ